MDATVDELLDRHLALLHCSERTRESYELMAARHIRPFLGGMRLLAVTAERLDGLYVEMLRCREHCQRPGRAQGQFRSSAGHVCRPLCAGTVRKIHYVLSSAFRRAVRWGWIDRSPTGDAAVPPARHPEPQPPTPAEAARIVAAPWTDPDLGPLVWLALATGARRGELCALRWRHIDTARGLIVIRSAIAQAGGRVWEKDTKLHQRRHIALDPATIAILDSYHLERQHRTAAVGVELSADGFVFSPRADARTCRSPQGLTSQYRKLVSRLRIRTSLHKLRHYSATELIRAGVDVRTVAGRLGHSDGGTKLAYYAAWVREADQRASRILMHRLPLPAPPTATVVPARPVRPSSPYRVLAAELRAAILDGILPAGALLPPVTRLAADHHVAASTAHRAVAVLAAEHLVTVSRCRRAVSTPPKSVNHTPAQHDGEQVGHDTGPAPGDPLPGRDGRRTHQWHPIRQVWKTLRHRHWPPTLRSPHETPVQGRGMARGRKQCQDRGLAAATVAQVVTNDAGDRP
jgi:integrase